jgi:hypothetical protein
MLLHSKCYGSKERKAYRREEISHFICTVSAIPPTEKG